MIVYGRGGFEPTWVRRRRPGTGDGLGRMPIRTFTTRFGLVLSGGFVLGAGTGWALTMEGALYRGLQLTDGAVIESTLINVLLFGLIFGTGGRLVFGLLAVLEAPLDVATATTPESLPATNRTTATRQVLVLAPTLTLAIAVGGRVITDLLRPFLGLLERAVGRLLHRSRQRARRLPLLRVPVHRLGTRGDPDPPLAAPDRQTPLGHRRLPRRRLPTGSTPPRRARPAGSAASDSDTTSATRTADRKPDTPPPDSRKRRSPRPVGRPGRYRGTRPVEPVAVRGYEADASVGRGHLGSEPLVAVPARVPPQARWIGAHGSRPSIRATSPPCPVLTTSATGPSGAGRAVVWRPGRRSTSGDRFPMRGWLSPTAQVAPSWSWPQGIRITQMGSRAVAQPAGPRSRCADGY
jgi:hypothetical protein